MGCKSEIKSTNVTCNIFGNLMISRHIKKQHSVVISTSHVEFVVADNCCTQVLCLKQQLLYFDLKLDCIPIKWDNTNTINLTKKSVLHSCTNQIELNNHFLRDHVDKDNVVFEYMDTKN